MRINVIFTHHNAHLASRLARAALYNIMKKESQAMTAEKAVMSSKMTGGNRRRVSGENEGQ